MPKTYPDFGTIGQESTQPDIDLTELASRLGSLSTLRRSGRLLLYDGFDTLSSWTLNIGGGTGFAISDPTFSFRGSNSLRAAPGSANMNLSRAAPILKYSKLGVEATIAPSTGVDYKVSIGLIIRQGALGQLIHKFTFDLTSLDFYHDGAAVTVLGNYTGFAITTPLVWVNMKMVIDMTTFKATRFFFNELEFSTNLAASTSSAPASPGIEVLISLVRNAAGNQNNPTFFNDLLLTADEP